MRNFILIALLLTAPPASGKSEAEGVYSHPRYGLAISDSEISTIEQTSGSRFDFEVSSKSEEVTFGLRTSATLTENDESERSRISAGPVLGRHFEGFSVFTYVGYFKESIDSRGYASMLSEGSLVGINLERYIRVNDRTDFGWGSFAELTYIDNLRYNSISKIGLDKPKFNIKSYGLTRGAHISIRVSL